MNELNQVLVIIPSFCPPPSLGQLCSNLFKAGFGGVLIVNDGSPEMYETIFLDAISKGAMKIALKVNEGKGSALRKGISHSIRTLPHFRYFIFCDDDGQHAAQDVEKVARFGLGKKMDFVIGTRDLYKMPFKSFIGNWIMCNALKMIYHINIPDTQSGLRFFSREAVGYLLNLNENRFSFELHSLIFLQQMKISVATCPIETIYFEKNKRTRFLALSDSWDVLKTLFILKSKKRNVKK